MVNSLVPDPKMAKDLAEERQREILEDVEADQLAEGEIPAGEYPSEEYLPVTDEEDDFLPAHKHNRHVHDEE